MITIERGSSLIKGSCNGCSVCIGTEGAVDVPVTEITVAYGMYGSVVRLCDTCLEEFKREMAKALAM